MAVPLIISTSLSGLGISLSWATSTTNTMGHLLSEPGPGVTLYLAGVPSSWTIANTSGNMSGSSFVFSAEPASWSALGSSANFTLYWTDATGTQQYAYTIPMSAGSTTFPARTWSPTSTAYLGVSGTAPVAQTSSSLSSVTPMYNVVISPEQSDTAVAVPGPSSVPALAQFFAGSARTGLIVLKDGAATPHLQPFLVGPGSGTYNVTCTTGSDPLGNLQGSTGSASHTGSSTATFSTADTSTAAPIYVGWYTA